LGPFRWHEQNQQSQIFQVVGATKFAHRQNGLRLLQQWMHKHPNQLSRHHRVPKLAVRYLAAILAMAGDRPGAWKLLE
jgi:hypothetical protein